MREEANVIGKPLDTQRLLTSFHKCTQKAEKNADNNAPDSSSSHNTIKLLAWRGGGVYTHTKWMKLIVNIPWRLPDVQALSS